MSHGANAKRRLSGRPLFWVGVIMIAALVVGYLARPEGQRAGNTLRSSFRTTPDGVAALARAIERLGRHTEARTTPLVDADPVRGTVMLLDAPLHPSPREVRGLLDRVRDGGTLLYAPPYTPGPLGLVPTQLMDSLGIRFRFRAVQDEILDRSLQEPRWSDHMLTAGLPEPMEPVIGMRGFRRGGDEELEEEPPADLPAVVPLLTAADHDGDEWMAAAELRLGEGRVVVFSDAGPLSNADALEDPLAVLAVRAALAYTDPADTVFFDEFHQGIGGQRSSAEVLADFFLGSPGGRALFHLVLLGFLALACTGLRLGAPTPAVAPPDRERRSPLEHVSALGDLYRKAGATGTAALLLVARLARATRNPPPRTVEQALDLLWRLDAEEGADTPLSRARDGLRADPPDLAAIATAIDEHLARRFAP